MTTVFLCVVDLQCNRERAAELTWNEPCPPQPFFQISVAPLTCETKTGWCDGTGLNILDLYNKHQTFFVAGSFAPQGEKQVVL